MFIYNLVLLLLRAQPELILEATEPILHTISIYISIKYKSKPTRSNAVKISFRSFFVGNTV